MSRYNCSLALFKGVVLLLIFQLFSSSVFAHGERAQQAGIRMRTIHWMDLDIQPRKVKVGENIVVTGKFIPSEEWPYHLASIEDVAFLNIGIPGPSFLRISSEVNGVPMMRSTSFKKGELYEYKIVLKARRADRYHIHPVVNVADAGPIIGNGYWVEVEESSVPFENSITTLTGETIDTETYGLSNVINWSVFWGVIGVLWIVFWIYRMPLFIPRYRKVIELGDDANKMISPLDRKIGLLFLTTTLVVILGGYYYAEQQYPITTPLQTGRIEVPSLDRSLDKKVEVSLQKAIYRIPGRSFAVTMEVTNHSDSAISVGEFNAANIRFINHEVMGEVKPQDEHDLVAMQGLRIEGGSIGAGQTKVVTLYANDALWEIYRLTSLIYDPDSAFAGMLSFYDKLGRRYNSEIGGPMLPKFM